MQGVIAATVSPNEVCHALRSRKFEYARQAGFGITLSKLISSCAVVSAMEIEFFLNAADKLAKHGNGFDVVGTRQRQSIRLQEGAQEEGVLRYEGAEKARMQRAIAESLHERMRQAR